jgi:2-polyprenyl-3-methyl-5-hydroxy-6-metoxy-1,4-benzoquinol methylase
VPSREYHEALWSAIPQDATPPGLERRGRFLLDSLSPGQRVLDLGCGDGELAARAADAGAEVVAVDVAQIPIDRARARHPSLDLRLIDGEGQWDLPDASFDAVWAGEVIEHVADTAGWLSEVRRVLRPGGLLLLTTPSHGPATRLWLALGPGAFAAHMHPLADHLRFYTRGGLTRLLGEFRFEAVSVRTAGFVPGRAELLASARRARF